MTPKRILATTALTLLLTPTALYLGDWALWRIQGSRMATVHVTRIVVAPLKGNREEYYPNGTATLPCTRSLFPQAAAGACWWLARNPTVYER